MVRSDISKTCTVGSRSSLFNCYPQRRRKLFSQPEQVSNLAFNRKSVPNTMSSKLENQASSEGSMFGFLRRQFERPTTLARRDRPQRAGRNHYWWQLGARLRSIAAIPQARALAPRSGRPLAGQGRRRRGEAASRVFRGHSLHLAARHGVLRLCPVIRRKVPGAPSHRHCRAQRRHSKPSFTTVAGTGHETMLQVNYFATALLTVLLLPVLKSKKASSGATGPPTLSLVGSDLAYM